MNSTQEKRVSQLRRAIWRELETGYDSTFTYSAINKILEAKTIDDKLTGLERLLETIVQGRTIDGNYIYNGENY